MVFVEKSFPRGGVSKSKGVKGEELSSFDAGKPKKEIVSCLKFYYLPQQFILNLLLILDFRSSRTSKR